MSVYFPGFKGAMFRKSLYLSFFRNLSNNDALGFPTRQKRILLGLSDKSAAILRFHYFTNWV